MDRWPGKVAVVSGASSGIGEAICVDLVNHGVIVVGLARRLDRLKELSTKLVKDKFHPIECDVTKEEDILKAFTWTEKHLGGIDILVNNAGVATNGAIIVALLIVKDTAGVESHAIQGQFHETCFVTVIDRGKTGLGPNSDTSTDEYRRVIDTNLIAPAICAREAIQSMKKRNVHGHVININSIAGQFSEALHIPIGMYAPSKYGLRALGTELRHEVIKAGLKVKISNISPGAVETEMMGTFKTLPAHFAMLKAKDISDAVIYVLGTPPSVEIPEVTIMPQNEVIGIPTGWDI